MKNLFIRISWTLVFMVLTLVALSAVVVSVVTLINSQSVIAVFAGVAGLIISIVFTLVGIGVLYSIWDVEEGW